MTKLAHAYLFDRKLQNEGFASACVTALIEKVHETKRFSTGIVTELYGHTRPGGKLRKLIVDLHLWLGWEACLDEPHEDAEAPDVFWMDIAFETGKVERLGRRRGYSWKKDLCAYHVHAATEICG